ncbi:DUF1656 domain-containing protein [Shimwellia pseudoproteus]|uniref:DUF1656 domain-containing protein n=1 Tax=Shimwellia pseudoproteus TaxID=570012 RepID=UPI0018EA496C|nr:DUF1656 domain-containing protein [Shimwellia pseudoproteus]MBJ3814019.1 DUF1656 domain-containing protein [Shimwellia pseudoproteus]
MIPSTYHTGLPLQDLLFGATVYFPPAFKAVCLGFFIWLILHRLFREWIYSGEVWHPTLLDLSLFVICVSSALAFLVVF